LSELAAAISIDAFWVGACHSVKRCAFGSGE
jgi:hypothetical protein